MSEDFKYDRRRFLGTAAVTIASGPLAMIESTHAQSRKIKRGDATTNKRYMNNSFDSVKQINAGLLMWDMPKPALPVARSYFASRVALRYLQLC